jgi:molecular chaperone GrpE
MSNTEDNLKNDEPAAAAEEQAPADETDESDFKQLQGDLDRFRDLALRTQADFDNYRKRAAREREDAVRYANVSLLERLIPILDNFELGLEAARADSRGSAILSGMEMVLRQLQDFLAAQGVEVIDATGQPFDPHLHEAIAQEESNEVPEGHAVRQLRKGYKLKDRLIRPANVTVSKGSQAAGA